MIPNKSDTIVILAIEHYLIRIGIKALIHRLGIEPIYYEWNNSSNTDTIDPQHANQFLIIDGSYSEAYKRTILSEQLLQSRILQLGFDETNTNNSFHHIALNDNKEDIFLKLQTFFGSILHDEISSDNGILSAREIDVLKEVALGYPNKEIADRLFISINTVITHRKNLTEKLGIKTIPGLTVYALMNKLIDPQNVT